MTTPGWYPDPHGRADHRWWDGTTWTEHVSSSGQAWSDPLQGPAPQTAPPAAAATPEPAAAPAGRRPGAPSWLPWVWVALGVAGVALLAVSLLGGDDGTAADPQASPTAGDVADSDPANTPAPTAGDGAGTGDADDEGTIVPLQAGLGQLNTYSMQFVERSIGPSTADVTESTVVVQRDTDADVTYTRTENTTATADDPEPQTTVLEVWQDATRSCQYDGDEFQAEDVDPAGRELADALIGLIDVIPVTPDPQYVADQTYNDVPARHYTFSLPGIGSQSGAQVVANQGDYWVAVDGDWLVHYELELDLRTGPEGDPAAEIYQGSMTFDVYDVNAPVAFTWPGGCDAALAAEG